MRPSPAAAVAAALLACAGPAADEPLVRVLAAAPAGKGVSPATAAEVRFSAPVDPAGLADGRWLLVVEAADLRAAVAAAEEEAGAAALGVPARVALQDGGARAVLVPSAPLRARTAHALVLSSRVRDAGGRPVLDPGGRHRTLVQPFETGAPEGPPPRPVITEARVGAATPQAGGEYVEVVNLGAGALDLAGHRLVKRTSSGSAACTVEAGPLVPPGGAALLAGGAWDGRYDLPADLPVLRCGASAVAGGLADGRAVDLSLADPLGAVVATLGAAGGPACAAAVERLDPAGPDTPANLGCAAGSPGIY